jgi:hypothetical protein
MRKTWIIVAVLLVLGVLLTLAWRAHQPKPPAPSTAEASALPPTVPEQVSPAPAPTSKREKISNLLGGLNHKHIEFYGKVVDQAGTPLPDVAVYASVIYNTGLTSGMAKSETKSDAQGLFSIKGMKGRTLGLSLDKPGYEYDGEKGPFHFTELVGEKDRYTPDRNNPVVLVMWKLQGAEPMIRFEQRGYPVPPTGSAVRIDLKTGKRVEIGGDIVITLRHAEAEIGQRLKRYPWNAEITVPGGGLIESTSRRMYLAPESGYHSTIALNQTGQETRWEPGIAKTYYLKTGSGHYARIRIDLNTDTSTKYDSYAVLTWWLNPKPGSRNLEFDPTRLAPHTTSLR